VVDEKQEVIAGRGDGDRGAVITSSICIPFAVARYNSGVGYFVFGAV